MIYISALFCIKIKRKSGEDMKKHLIIISAIILLGIFLIVSATKKSTNVIYYDKETTDYQQEEIKYVLKDYNGRIALFYESKEKPIEVYNVFTSSLPETDAQQLEKGIAVTEDELNKVLSDYIS